MRHLWIALIVVFASGLGVSAEEWGRVGYGRLINNDFIGDLKDRGQTGSYVSSRIYAKHDLTSLPNRPWQLLEFRLGADVKAPDDLRQPAAKDRPFAGSVALGLHTHFERSAVQYAFGGEIVATGPQTRLDDFQTALHDALGVAPLSAATKAAQIGNGFHPGLIAEAGRPFQLSQRAQVRPFVEGRLGVETLLRAGVDITLGAVAQDGILVRDGITGQRYRTVLDPSIGHSFVVGFDTAYVEDSAYLPKGRGYQLTDHRDRLRAGIQWQGKKGHGFFGVTYLGKEFTAQTEGQVVGSVRLSVDF